MWQGGGAFAFGYKADDSSCLGWVAKKGYPIITAKATVVVGGSGWIWGVVGAGLGGAKTKAPGCGRPK